MGPLSRKWRKLARSTRTFVQGQTGSVATVFALSLLPTLGLMSIAIDFSNASRVRSMLAAAADSATLAGVSDSVVKPTLNWVEQKEATLKAIKVHFESIATDLKNDGILKKATYDVKIKNNVIDVKLCFDAAVRTSTMALVGKNFIEVSGCAEASSAPPVYVSVFALVDASGSMGIGASTADQMLMNDKLSCAFACHVVNWTTPIYNPKCSKSVGATGLQTTECANQIGAKTRFNVVQSALAEVVDEAKKMSKTSDQFRFALYKFSNQLTEVQAVTQNLNVVKTAVQNMEMDAGGAGTNFREAVKELLSKIPNGGDGKSPLTPKIILLIMTDGVEGNVKTYKECRDAVVDSVTVGNFCNYWGGWNPDDKLTINNPGFYQGVERSQAIDWKVCDGFKTKGITVATLNTEYVTPPGSDDARFQQIQSMLRPVIRKTMAKCASRPEYAYYATTPGEIQQATDMMFRSVMEKARLTR